MHSHPNLLVILRKPKKKLLVVALLRVTKLQLESDPETCELGTPI